MRMSSTRLPGKVLLPISDGGETVFEILMARLAKSERIEKSYVLTSDRSEDLLIVEMCERLGLDCVVGDLENVLGRYIRLADKIRAELDEFYILRVTGDCPFVDPVLIDQMIEEFERLKPNYLSNTITRSFPDGFDVEIFDLTALRFLAENATSRFDREHVTSAIANIPNRLINFQFPNPLGDFSNLRITLDTEQDYLDIKNLVSAVGLDAITVQTATEYMLSKK